MERETQLKMAGGRVRERETERHFIVLKPGPSLILTVR